MQELLEKWKEICEKAPELEDDALHLAFIVDGKFITIDGLDAEKRHTDMWENDVENVVDVQQWCFGNVPAYLSAHGRGGIYQEMAMHVAVPPGREGKIVWQLLKDCPHIQYPKTYKDFREGFFLMEGPIFDLCGLGALIRLPQTAKDAVNDGWDYDDDDNRITMDTFLKFKGRHNPVRPLKLSSWDDLAARTVDWEMLALITRNFGIDPQHCDTIPLTPYACCLYACSTKRKG